jgi:uncharacterized protein DUF6627
MTSVMNRTLCRLLIVLMAWTPFQMAYAGVISTDQAVAGSAQADRAAVLSVISRSDVSGQLQALGLDAATAKDRVAALTDEEVRSLNGQLQALPAGGDGWVVAAVILIGVLIWYFWFRR